MIEAALKIAARNKLAQDADLEDLPELLEMLEQEKSADLEPAAPMVNPEKEKEEKIMELLNGKVDEDTLAAVADALRRDDAEDDLYSDYNDEPDEGGWDSRARNARDRLGRDETEEEREKREKEQSAEDARRRLGRDETEEERDRREGEDKRARDKRRARDAWRRAEDARWRHADDRRHDASDKRAEDKWRADDRKLEEDARRARDAYDRHRAGDRRRASDRRRDDAEDRRRDADDRRRAADQPPPFKGKPEVGGEVTKEAMDSAIATAIAYRDQQHREAREAEKFVRPIVGELAIAYDSADEIYKAALEMKGVPTAGIHPSAYRAMLDLARSNSASERPRPRNGLASDAAMVGGKSIGFHDMFPDAKRIQVQG